jgi:hypothetical protein
MRTLDFHRENAPLRKLRGGRRYFAGVQRKADALVISSTPTDWWNLWHYHADWPGWGNRGWRYRLPHIRALATVFRKICLARAASSSPFQAWIVLDGEDAGQDATYLHTPNPYQTQFPMVLANVEWGTSALQSTMAALLPDFGLEIGWTRTRNAAGDAEPAWHTTHWVYAKGFGIPIRLV